VRIFLLDGSLYKLHYPFREGQWQQHQLRNQRNLRPGQRAYRLHQRLWRKLCRNHQRVQLQQTPSAVNMSANAPSQTVFSIGYDFHLGNGTSGADNGNVYGITNYKDQNRNQTFTYDALNRLISAQNAGTNCAATVIGGKSEYWGNSYGYDAWGNLLQKSVTKCGAESLNITVLANNRLSGYGYDAAGNMTTNPTDNVTLNYDQENRITAIPTAKQNTCRWRS
jgi:hypothetical protein